MEDDLNKLQAVFGKATIVNTTYEVRATAKFYPQFTKVFIPIVPYTKSDPFVEARTDNDEDAEDLPGNVKDTEKTSNEDDLARSLRKTKTLISDYILCNEFDIFATFTFSPKKTADRFNPNLVKLQMANWLKNQRTRNGKFSYLIVPELHKDGKALHFHALMNNYPGILVDSGKNSKGRPVYYFKSYTLGFNSAVKIDNIEKVSSYVKKYITKDMPQFRGKHRFWATKGLKRPRIEDNPSDWYLRETPTRVYESEYGRTLYFINNPSLARGSNSFTEDSPAPGGQGR